DDLNNAEPLPPSFDLVQQPEQVDHARQMKEEAAVPRQEAMVKGITPAQPAPLPTEKLAPIASNEVGESWFVRIMSWFRAKPEPVPVPTPKPVREERVEPQREGRRERRAEDRERHRGEGRRGGDRRDEQRRGGDRRERGEAREQRAQQQPRNGQQQP